MRYFSSDWSGSCGDDFIMYERPQFDIERSHPYKAECCYAIICWSGQASGSVNLKEYHLITGSVLILLPGSIVEMTETSEDFSAGYILYSMTFMESLNIASGWQLWHDVQERPWRQLEQQEFAAIESYYAMCKGTIEIEDNPNRLEILRLITKAFFLGLGHYMHKDIQSTANTREEEITRQFINHVQEEYSEFRDVGHYAEKMAVSPKYLSMCVKKASGRAPVQWIAQYVVMSAKADLASTDKTIAEIAYELHFPTQSDFGRYFKSVVGLSPKAWRNSIKRPGQS